MTSLTLFVGEIDFYRLLFILQYVAIKCHEFLTVMLKSRLVPCHVIGLVG